MAIKGLKDVLVKTAEAAELASQPRVRYLYLGDGDSALIRFIDDEEMVQTKIHEYEEMTPEGKKYRKPYCLDNLAGIPCKWDAMGNVPKNVFVFLVYVHHIIHKTQNPELNRNADAVKWDPVKVGTQTFYKEDVGEIRVLRTKFGKSGYIRNSILGFVDEYGTLCDRDYKFVRTGNGTDTSYSFIPKDPSDMPSEVKEARKESPTLEEILIPKKKEEVEVEEEIVENDEIPVAVEEGKSAKGKKKNSDIEDLF